MKSHNTGAPVRFVDSEGIIRDGEIILYNVGMSEYYVKVEEAGTFVIVASQIIHFDVDVDGMAAI